MPATGSIIHSLASIYNTPCKQHSYQHLTKSTFLSICTYCGEVLVVAVFPTEPAFQQHILQLVTQPANHLSGVNMVIRGWGIVVEVQQVEETVLVAVFEDGQAPLHHCVIGIHQVHPVANVIQVGLGQNRHTEQVFIADSHCWE